MTFKGAIDTFSQDVIAGWASFDTGSGVIAADVRLQLGSGVSVTAFPAVRGDKLPGFTFRVPPELRSLDWRAFIDDYRGVVAFSAQHPAAGQWPLPLYKSVLRALSPPRRAPERQPVQASSGVPGVGGNPAASLRKEVWEANIHQESSFWERWLTKENFSEARTARMSSARPLGLPMSLFPREQGTYTILDVGSGPVSTIGCQAPGKLVVLFAVDPLADEYNEMLNRLGNHDTVRPIKVDGERLAEVFPFDYFDVCNCANALDHCYDPMTVLRQMVAVCKPEGWINLVHIVNEGENENYAGLHQWNLDAPEGRFVIWNKTAKHDIASSIPEVGEVRISRSGVADRALLVQMQKRRI